jgi:methylphosphotriester-DNA--protein-cysteine methyltransferase
MINHNQINDLALHRLIKNNEICLGGNTKLKIYGKLHCKSGKRMKKQNRVFFTSENEAITMNYRPCGNCMGTKYQYWKNGLI